MFGKKKNENSKDQDKAKSLRSAKKVGKIKNMLPSKSKDKNKTIINLYVKNPSLRNNPIKLIYILSAVIAVVLIFYVGFVLYSPGGNKVTLAQVIDGLKHDQYKEVIIQGNKVSVIDRNDKVNKVEIEQGSSFLELLQRDGVKLEDLKNVKVKVQAPPTNILDAIGVGIDLMFLLVIAWFATRFVSSFGGKGGLGGDPLKGFGASKAQLITPDKVKVRFKDVAGLAEVKEEVVELVDFLKKPKAFWEMGARIPKGVLLEGPPGTGKTLVAKAIAGEAQVPFLYTSGSSFEEMLVGTGASRVRDLFAKARALAPCIIFIDEIDAVAKRRGVDFRASYSDQTLNQLLVEMDGMKENSAVIVMAATNRADLLDPALLRPGRFDRKITFHLPHLTEREAILKVHARNKHLAPEIDLHEFAIATIGLSGAQIENVLNEAAILAVRAGRKQIIKKDIWEALSRVSMGPARRYLSITKEELERTAFHEAGHAIVAAFMEGAQPVRNISIIPRGHALGITNLQDEVDSYNRTYKQLFADISMAFGGLAAELLKFGKQDLSTGASSDIKHATQVVKAMVRQFGMSDKLGFLHYGFDSDYVEFNFLHNYSDKTAYEIDEESKKIANSAFMQAQAILKRESKLLDVVAQALLAKESLTSQDFYKLATEYGTKKPFLPEATPVKSVHEWIEQVRNSIQDGGEIKQ